MAMSNNIASNIELSTWARTFCQERKESVDYFLEFGSPIEKALVSKVVELAGGQA
jgi:hypothetical protein